MSTWQVNNAPPTWKPFIQHKSRRTSHWYSLEIEIDRNVFWQCKACLVTLHSVCVSEGLTVRQCHWEVSLKLAARCSTGVVCMGGWKRRQNKGCSKLTQTQAIYEWKWSSLHLNLTQIPVFFLLDSTTIFDEIVSNKVKKPCKYDVISVPCARKITVRHRSVSIQKLLQSTSYSCL